MVERQAMDLVERLFAEIGALTRDGAGVTRASYGSGEQIASDTIMLAAREIGLEVSVDPALNLYVTLPGLDRSSPAIVIGSHLDSVPNGGNFDGLAGILAGIACQVTALREGPLGCDLVTMGIRAEENAWFGARHIGSRIALGLFENAALDRAKRVDTGRSLREHMVAAGADVAAIEGGHVALPAQRLRCFLELHIEQGPVMVARGKPVGVVTGIRGNRRHNEIRCQGESGHSGALPRSLRKDAVMAVAEFISTAEIYWRAAEARGEDLVMTFGKLFTNSESHGTTVVPGEASFSLDIRSHDAATLDSCYGFMRKTAEGIAVRRGVTFQWGPNSCEEPIVLDRDLRGLILDGFSEISAEPFEIASGAGHDAGDFQSAGIPAAMIFVRNENGSHNPREAMAMDDFARAVHLLWRTVVKLARSPSGSRMTV